MKKIEAEASSDDDSKEKIYKKRIEERAKAKQMKIPKSNYKSKIMEKNKKKKKYKDEEENKRRRRGKKEEKRGKK